MKILHLNTSDIEGGAARAAYRIHKGLCSIGVESKMLVQVKKSDDYTVYDTIDKKSKIKKIVNSRIDRIKIKLNASSIKTPWSINAGLSGISKIINDFSPDIVNFHWINGGFIPISEISRIKAPIVWTMHDMWPFTGGCHYVSDHCEKYLKRCYNCEQLIGKNICDLSSYVFNKKKQVYSQNIYLVGPSRWIAEAAKRSTLFFNNKVSVIHNGIDTDVYAPIDKCFARKALNLHANSKIILFGAMGAASDPRKGFQYLYPAIMDLYGRIKNDNIQVVVFGSSQPQQKQEFGFPVHYTGRIFDDISLRILYSAADVMVVPSHAENFPNTILEAMACGTPCVGFDIGGIPDFIDHKVNGYLAKHYDTDDLAAGIEYILSDAVRQKLLGYKAREKVESELSVEKIANKYLELYQSVIGAIYDE